MTPDRIDRLEESFDALKPQAEGLVNSFYQILFERAPQVRSLFPDDLTEQKKKLLASLAFVVAHLRKPEELAGALRDLGARHVGYGTCEAHYPVVRDCMLEAMSASAGVGWTPQLAQDWRAALDHVAGLMIEGANRSRAQAA